jgi:RNA polymerase sigma factor (sigma-70 family)
MPPTFCEEAHLCALLYDNDKDAFTYLYDHYAPALFGAIKRVVRNESIAEDLLQDVFISVYRKIKTYDSSKGRLFTWLLTIAHNRAVDYQRSAHVRNTSGCLELKEEHSVQQAIAEAKAEQRLLFQQIRKLQPTVRELVELIYVQGYTHEQAAQLHRIPLGTVKTRVRRGIEQLRAMCTEPKPFPQFA